MLPATAITELLAIRHPILQAPMAGAATPQLAASVSAAGGLGALGSAVLTADELREQAAALRCTPRAASASRRNHTTMIRRGSTAPG